MQRADDEENTVRRRLEVYEQQTRPLADFYAAQGVLRTIDANASVDDVTLRLIALLESLPAQQRLRNEARTLRPSSELRNEVEQERQ